MKRVARWLWASDGPCTALSWGARAQLILGAATIVACLSLASWHVIAADSRDAWRIAAEGLVLAAVAIIIAALMRGYEELRARIGA